MEIIWQEPTVKYALSLHEPVNSGLIGLGVVVAVLMAVAFPFALRRKGVRVPAVVQMSHLKCPKCAGEFDYEWVVASSFTSIRLGKSRYFRCPRCQEWSTFDILSTRVDSTSHHCELRVGPS